MRGILGYTLGAWSCCISTSLLLGCGSAEPELEHTTRGSDLTLGSDSVPAADVAQGAPVSLKRLPLAAARDVIRKHWQEKFAKQKNVVATTQTSDGTVFDWSLAPADERVPPPAPPAAPLPEGASYVQSVLDTEPEARGPSGTVPSVRPNVEALLAEWGDTVPDDPDQLLDALHPPQAVPGDGYYHSGYIMKSSSMTSNDLEAMYARMSLWFSGHINAGDHVVAQIWMGAGPGTPGTNQMDTIEAGSRQTATLPPFLFMYFTNSNYLFPPNVDAGYCTQGYASSGNDLPHGWHSVSGTSWPPNVTFANNFTRDPNCGGSDDNCKLSWLDNNGNHHDRILGLEWQRDTHGFNSWWLYVNNVAVGYFDPTCTVSGQVKNMFHDRTNGRGLLGGANRAQFYGEVFDSAHPTATNTWMGNGYHPVQGQFPTGISTRAAWMDQLEVFHFSQGWKFYSQWPGAQRGLGNLEDSACYSNSVVVAASNGFYYGGGGTDEGGTCGQP